MSIAICIEKLAQLIDLEGCLIKKAKLGDVDTNVVVSRDNKEYGVIRRNDDKFIFWWEQDEGIHETVQT